MLNQTRLKKLLHYNKKTGVFTRKHIPKMSRNVVRGDIAGCLSNGYLMVRLDGGFYKNHRLAFLYVLGYMPENGVDHINRNKTDNSWENLREASQQCNMQNTGLISSNKSGIRGVYWNKQRKKWAACIKVNGKGFSLGLYSDKTEAHIARLTAEDCIDGWHCNSNPINRIKELIKNRGIL